MSSSTPVARSGDGSDISRQGQRPRGDLFQTLFGWEPFRPLLAQSAWPISIDINRSEEGYNVELPVPGFRPEDIEVTVQDDTLVISGKSERRQFTRSLVLPDEIDADNISAHVENGLLCVHLARRPETRPRRIQVQSGEAHELTQRVQSVSGTDQGSSSPAAATSGSSQN